jgi:hypothetical protein
MAKKLIAVILIAPECGYKNKGFLFEYRCCCCCCCR